MNASHNIYGVARATMTPKWDYERGDEDARWLGNANRRLLIAGIAVQLAVRTAKSIEVVRAPRETWDPV